MDIVPVPDFNHTNDVIYLDGLFFIRSRTIRENTDLVKQTLGDLYRHMNFN